MFGYFSVTAEEHAQNTHITVRYVYVRPHSPRYNRPVHVSLTTHAGGQPSRSTGSELALCSVANTLPKFRAPTDQQSSSSSYQKKEKKKEKKKPMHESQCNVMGLRSFRQMVMGPCQSPFPGPHHTLHPSSKVQRGTGDDDVQKQSARSCWISTRAGRGAELS